jgi:hypothetical protein
MIAHNYSSVLTFFVGRRLSLGPQEAAESLLLTFLGC